MNVSGIAWRLRGMTPWAAAPPPPRHYQHQVSQSFTCYRVSSFLSRATSTLLSLAHLLRHLLKLPGAGDQFLLKKILTITLSYIILLLKSQQDYDIYDMILHCWFSFFPVRELEVRTCLKTRQDFRKDFRQRYQIAKALGRNYRFWMLSNERKLVNWPLYV